MNVLGGGGCGGGGYGAFRVLLCHFFWFNLDWDSVSCPPFIRCSCPRDTYSQSLFVFQINFIIVSAYVNKRRFHKFSTFFFPQMFTSKNGCTAALVWGVHPTVHQSCQGTLSHKRAVVFQVNFL